MTDDLTRPLHVSPDGRFLAASDGRPFFWLADTAWCLFHRLDRDETEHYLADRAAKGFTVVQAVLTLQPGESATSPSRQGELPFVDADPARPNPAYFDHIAWVLERARHHGLRVAAVPMFAWGIWSSPSASDWASVTTAETWFTRDHAREFGRYLATRFRGCGLTWMLGGDVTPVLTVGRGGELQDLRPICDAFAGGVREVEGDSAFITYHPSVWGYPGAAEPRTSRFFADRDWLTMNGIQSSHFGDHVIGLPTSIPGTDFHYLSVYSYEPIAAEYASLPVRPVIDLEPCFEDLSINVELTVADAEARGYWRAPDARRAAYSALFAGAAGHTYGHHSVWQMYDPAFDNGVQLPIEGLSWRIALDAEGAGQMRHLRALFESRPQFTRIPDDAVIRSPLGEGGSRISALRDRAGRYLMVYLRVGGSVDIDLTRIAGPRAVAWWYDVRTGAATRIGEFPTDRVSSFRPESSADWVLVVDDADAGFVPPGVAPALTGPESDGR